MLGVSAQALGANAATIQLTANQGAIADDRILSLSAAITPSSEELGTESNLYFALVAPGDYILSSDGWNWTNGYTGSRMTKGPGIENGKLFFKNVSAPGFFNIALPVALPEGTYTFYLATAKPGVNTYAEMVGLGRNPFTGMGTVSVRIGAPSQQPTTTQQSYLTDKGRNAVIMACGNYMQRWDTDHYYLQGMLDHIKDIGFTGITFDYSVNVDPTGKVLDDFSLDDMMKAIDYSRLIGLNVTAKVHWSFNDCGNINQFNTPAGFDFSLFFKGASDHFARISPLLEARGVGIQYLGTENNNFAYAEHHDQWADIIKTIRKTYKGKLAFDGNYGEYQYDSFWKIGIWDLVDQIALSFYPHFSNTRVTDINEIQKKWFYRTAAEIADQWGPGPQPPSVIGDIIRLRETYGKEVVLGEVAFAPTAASLMGFQTVAPEVLIATPPDYDAQAAAYEAMMEVLNKNLKGVVTGINVWGYDYLGYDPQYLDPANSGYLRFYSTRKYNDMRNTKPEDVLKRYFKNSDTYHTTSTTTAGPVDDTIYIGSGDDIVDGGAGVNTVVFSGKRANYTIAKTPAGFAVVDKVGADGNDTLKNIHLIKFADTVVDLRTGNY